VIADGRAWFLYQRDLCFLIYKTPVLKRRFETKASFPILSFQKLEGLCARRKAGCVRRPAMLLPLHLKVAP
jgi:hypothetical protein